MDLQAVADFLGGTRKTAESRVARGLIPHRKWGGRIIVLRSELMAFLAALDGCTPKEALANIAAIRDGGK